MCVWRCSFGPFLLALASSVLQSSASQTQMGQRAQNCVTGKTPNLPPKSWGSLGRESVMGVWMKTLFTNTFIRRTTLMVTRSQAEG